MNAANKYLFGLSIEEMQKKRENVYERINLNKKAPAVTEAYTLTKRGNTDMEKITINVDNINPTMANAIKSFVMPQPELNEKMIVSTTDVEYVEFLIDKKDFKKAREVMNNLKSVAKSIDCLIMETDSYLASFEV